MPRKKPKVRHGATNNKFVPVRMSQPKIKKVNVHAKSKVVTG